MFTSILANLFYVSIYKNYFKICFNYQTIEFVIIWLCSMLLFYMFIKEIEVAYQKQKHLLYQNFNMPLEFTLSVYCSVVYSQKIYFYFSLKTVKIFVNPWKIF